MRRSKLLQGVIFSLVLLILVTSSFKTEALVPDDLHSLSPQEEVTKGRPEGVFKLITYNIWETGRNITWIDVIKEENPDLALFVETGKWSSSDGTFDAALADMNAQNPDEKPYKGFATQAVSSTDGEALISRYPIKYKTQLSELTLDDGTTFKPSHDFLYAIVDIAGVEVHIFGNHLACCETGYDQRVRDQEGLMNFFDSLGEVPIIYTGDFNSHSPEDVGEVGPNDSNLGTRPIEILLNSSDPAASQVHQFTDVYRSLNPYSKGYTYVDSQFQSRIDYVFVNQLMVDTLVNSTVVTTEAGLNGADHRPILSTFNMKYNEFDLRPPTQVSGFQATTSDTSVDLSWIANTEPDFFKYQIWRDGCLLTEVPHDSLSFSDTRVDPNTVYKYWITPADENKNFGTPREIYVNSSYGQILKPSAPLLSASSQVGRVELNWTSQANGSPITKSLIMRSLSPDTGYIQIAETTGYSYNDTKARAGITVYYKVVTVNLVGSSNPSNVASAQVLSGEFQTTKAQSKVKAKTIAVSEVNCPETLNIIPFPEKTSSSTSVTSSSESETKTSPFSPIFIIAVALISIPILRLVEKKSWK